MLHELKRIIDADDRLHEDDFKKAAQELMSRQFLLRAKSSTKKNYELVMRHQRYFATLVDAFNHRLVVNEQDGYAGVVPIDFVTRMRLEETLVVLVLNLMHGEKILAQEQEDDGSAMVTIEEFEDRYQQTTRRQLPGITEFKDLCKPFCDASLIELGNENDDPRAVYIRILPTITDMLGSDALERLAGYVVADNECELDESEEDADHMETVTEGEAE